jgi:hypothetical protein
MRAGSGEMGRCATTGAGSMGRDVGGPARHGRAAAVAVRALVKSACIYNYIC